MSTVSDLLRQVAALSPGQLADFLRRAQALASVSNTAVEREGNDAVPILLYHALSHHLRIQLHYTAPPHTEFLKRSKLAKSVQQAFRSVEEQIRVLLPGATRVELASVCDLIADLAVQRAREGVYETPWVAINTALHNLPSLLDQHFPGYASSGLLKLVLTMRVRRTEGLNGESKT